MRWLAALALATACGGTDEPPCPGDACVPAPDDGSSADGVTPPDIPWLAAGAPPVAAPDIACASGWREVAATEEGDPVTCDPYPVGGALDCPDGQAHFPGEPACSPVGSACSPGDFSEVLPTDRRIVYVQPGATGGDGMSPATPYGSLAEFALGPLPTGTVIALSRGIHDGPVRLARGHVLWGVCAADTILSGGAPSETDALVTWGDARGEMRDLTVGPTPRVIARLLGPGTEGIIDGVALTGGEGAGVIVTLDARLTASSVVLRDTQGRMRDGRFGRGMGVEPGATVDVTRALFAGNREIGIHSNGPTATLTIADAVVRDTRPVAADLTGGRGFGVEAAAVVDVSRALVVNDRDIAFFVAAGSTATLTDVVVRDTQSQDSDGMRGSGLDITEGAMATVSRSVFEQSRSVALLVSEPSTLLALADVVVRDTAINARDGYGGRGLNVEAGARAEVTRAFFARNREVGVYVGQSGSSGTFADLVVADTGPSARMPVGGRGMTIEQGGTIELTSASLANNQDVGLFVGGTDAAATITDVRVFESRGQEGNGLFGRGLNVQGGAELSAVRVEVVRSRDVGVAALQPDTTLTLTDVVVRETLGRESDGTAGRALTVQLSAVADVTRAVFADARDIAVSSIAGGASVTLADVVVRDTLPQLCVATGCPEADVGHGLGSYDGASLSASRFLVERAHTCGVHIARDAQIDLVDGQVRMSAIGACLQVEGYDIDRLTRNVMYVENGLNLDATRLPVPEPVAPAAGF